MSLIYEQTHNTIRDLAKALDQLPQNHDDREEVIADMIKKFVHQEKYMIYSNLTHWKDAGLEWIFSRIIIPKIETHKELSEKWAYNTPYSYRNYGKDPSKVVPSALSKIAKELNAKITITTRS